MRKTTQIGLISFVVGDIWLGIGVFVYSCYIVPKTMFSENFNDRVVSFAIYCKSFSGLLLITIPFILVIVSLLLLGISAKISTLESNKEIRKRGFIEIGKKQSKKLFKNKSRENEDEGKIRGC